MAEDPVATDAQLVESTRLGDAAAFDALVRRYIRPAHVVALAIIGDRADAEDICQDVFVRVIERIDECRRPERFAAWFFAIVRSTTHNFRRRERRRRGEEVDAEHTSSSDNPARDAERADLSRRIGSALLRLSDIESEVVLLHDLEDWTHAAIAKALGISEVNSRQHLFVARRKLREHLTDLQPDRSTHD
jgi:RNA polymerase sigma-70 factor, ECF subfamily